LKGKEILSRYRHHPKAAMLSEKLSEKSNQRIFIEHIHGSAKAFLAAALFQLRSVMHIIVLQDKEQAAYFYNDLQNIFDEKDASADTKKVLFYPTSYKRPYEEETINNINVLSRTEVLKRINSQSRKLIVVTYPEAMSERVISKKYLTDNTLKIETGDDLTIDFVTDLLLEYDFERVDFVISPGQFSLRGGIVDVFSFGNENPYRIEFFGDEVSSIRTFNPADQLSITKLKKLTIIPNLQNSKTTEERSSFLSYIPGSAILWFDNMRYAAEVLEKEYKKVMDAYNKLSGPVDHLPPQELFSGAKTFVKDTREHHLVELNRNHFDTTHHTISWPTKPQPSFNKKFDMLLEDLHQKHVAGFQNYIFAGNAKQLKRLSTIFEDMQADKQEKTTFHPVNYSIHEGFIDEILQITCYTDHQIFERYHRFHLREAYKNKEAITLKELNELKPGDYVTHIDHGIGRYDGLEKIDNKGKTQEAIRLIYANNDLLYVNIHSLHRITKYTGKDGTQPVVHRLGSNTWNKLKNKTKSKVKDIAKDLINLYAKRKATKGFAFSPDSYLQHELEASFIYEDTPDQVKATQDTKTDMEKQHPMDRLVCGDVGFGKTEVAIRAAFKAVTDNKQVAILVPTTILALQHYNTFRERLRDFPCTVDYVNRFKSSKEIKNTLGKLVNGEVDILVGTHRIISKDIKFKDLGLLIIDEEQKFGVSAKEKIRHMRANVDTLTLTATPIPRTLQFSMMGARDLSTIDTPPPNRYPIKTEMHPFSEEVIRDAIAYEVSRGGQVYFVHNRVKNIMDVAGMIKRFAPDVKIAIGHGQMDGHKLEQVMLDFIEGEYDILLATTIIESGLDIPNVNTIIINDAQNYGLSDLHQLRGRVGRSNKKAFCYLLAPPLSSLTPEARRRLEAVEKFSDLGSGFQIAMRDLDIRGAGNILGAEQSGFISDIGYEMYQKILDEAMQELKSNEFADLYADEQQQLTVGDCQIETDFEIMLPDDYVTNIQERLTLYKDLDSAETEEELQTFRNILADRFGPLPEPTEKLINVIRVRWKAKAIGFEKLILKKGKMVGHFSSNPDSPYYKTKRFERVLEFIKKEPQRCQMKETANKLTLIISEVNSVQTALKIFNRINQQK
jgi:transcription-repair coupling factor (superfamily II helicase)